MSFPITYVGELIINKPEGFIFDNYLESVKQHLNDNKDPFKKKYKYTYPLPLIGLNLRYTLALKDEYATVQATFIISLFELNIIFLLFAGLSVFFGSANHLAFSILSGLIAIGYYWFGISTVSNVLKAIVKQNFESSHFLEEPGLWDKQQQWIKDQMLCSACGVNVNPYSEFCTNCGMRVSKHAVKISDNVSQTMDSESISYSYKKPNADEKNRS